MESQGNSRPSFQSESITPHPPKAHSGAFLIPKSWSFPDNHEAELDIETKHDLIDRMRRTLKQVYGMVENAYDPVNILSEVDCVYWDDRRLGNR